MKGFLIREGKLGMYGDFNEHELLAYENDTITERFVPMEIEELSFDCYYWDQEAQEIKEKKVAIVTMSKSSIDDNGEDLCHVTIEIDEPIAIIAQYSSLHDYNYTEFTGVPVNGFVEFDIKSLIMGQVTLMIKDLHIRLSEPVIITVY